MLEERGEPANDTARDQPLGHATEFVERQACGRRAGDPGIGANLIHGELPLQRLQHAPLAAENWEQIRESASSRGPDIFSSQIPAKLGWLTAHLSHRSAKKLSLVTI